MAYDNNGARIGAAGHFASRITAALIGCGAVTKETAADTFADFTSAALDVLNGLEGTTPAPQVAKQTLSAEQVQQVMADEFGDITVAVEGITILNKEGAFGAIPDWALAQFKAAGATKVFDNRATKTGNQPWFKTPKDAEKYGEPADKAFWPPR